MQFKNKEGTSGYYFALQVRLDLLLHLLSFRAYAYIGPQHRRARRQPRGLDRWWLLVELRRPRGLQLLY